MKATLQKTMRAAAIDQFGDIDVIKTHTLPMPQIDPGEVLIRVQSAGVGVWDPYERTGELAEEFGATVRFPHVLGTEGAGIVEDVGGDVTQFKVGDRVYAMSLLNPKGGFYAQYAAVKADSVSLIPGNLSVEQAGVMPADAITALQGLDDTMGLQPGETVMIFGASGGIGHLAVQLAKRMDLRVLAVASGRDGVALAEILGADVVVDGHKDDIAEAARKLASSGLDAALLTAGGEAAEKALAALHDGGRVAYPNGVEPVPRGRSGLRIQSYNGEASPQSFKRLNRLIEAGPFVVHVARVFTLDQAAEAHRALESHYLGKLAIRPD